MCKEKMCIRDRAKTEIFKFLRPDGHIVLNGDDDKLITVKEYEKIKPVFFGMSNECQVYGDKIVSRGLKLSLIHICAFDYGTGKPSPLGMCIKNGIISVSYTHLASRFAYNWALAREIENYEKGGKFLSDAELRKEFTKLRRSDEYAWLLSISNNVTKQAIKDACTAYKNFFRGLQKFPRFKSKKRSMPKFYHCLLYTSRCV